MESTHIGYDVSPGAGQILLFETPIHLATTNEPLQMTAIYELTGEPPIGGF